MPSPPHSSFNQADPEASPACLWPRLTSGLLLQGGRLHHKPHKLRTNCSCVVRA